MKLKLICGAVLGLALGMNIQSGPDNRADRTTGFNWLHMGISQAQAYRGRAIRTTRRVARRTTRRVARRHSIAGCAVWRAGYWNCGGVYYRGVVQNGATVYVVVNP